ncbi:MAG: hypothetical protein EGP67_11340 [Bacteroidales bacterium]|nr:hypothetical protein [Bacteroidales bacterium]
MDFDLFGNLIHGHMPYMKFLFVRSDICRQLPSDSTSRWTPLPLTMQFPLLGLARDLHPLDNAHAERTKKTSQLQPQPGCFYLWGNDCYFTITFTPFTM